MSDFIESLAASGLGAALTADGITFVEDNAKLIVRAAAIEKINPVVLAVTWRSEASPPFEIWSIPQTNGHPDDFTRWDIGCVQISWHWWHKALEIGDIKPGDLTDELVFGKPENNQPQKVFDGEPLSNIRAGAKTLMAIHPKGTDPQTGLVYDSEDEERACRYTGPTHRERRLQIYRQLEPSLTKFFQLYSA